tara:strand:- start:27 stop:341 length:315 start_codon:yes stop_codon:yes gene_type:complete
MIPRPATGSAESAGGSGGRFNGEFDCASKVPMLLAKKRQPQKQCKTPAPSFKHFLIPDIIIPNITTNLEFDPSFSDNTNIMETFFDADFQKIAPEGTQSCTCLD